MNSGYYTFFTGLCGVLVISSLVKIISPKEKMNRIMTLILGVFFLMCMTSPVVSLIKNLELPQENEVYVPDDYDVSEKYVLKETSDYLSTYLRESLISEGIDCSSVKLVMSNDENKGIYPDSLCIYLNKYSDDDCKKAAEIIKSAIGLEPEIIYVERGNENE